MIEAKIIYVHFNSNFKCHRNKLQSEKHYKLNSVKIIELYPKLFLTYTRRTSALRLNESTWIIDGFNELIVDFFSSALDLFLDSTQPQKSKTNPFF